MRKMCENIKQNRFAMMINALAFIIVIAGVVTAIKMNFVGRSLWYDEAALAYSFSLRDFWSLTREPLEVYQSAPAAWLYLVKIFTLIFGNTDFVLRLPSILFYIGILVLTFLISKDVFSSKYPMLPTAFVASLPLLLQYANIFKPYICDGFVALLCIWIYFLYERGKVNTVILGVVWAVLIWFSNPVCFVEGGFLMIAGAEILWKKNWKKIKEVVLIVIFLGVSFIGDYLYWLRPAATSGSLQGFWAEYRFPVLIKSWDDVWQIKRMGGILFSQFYRLKWVIFAILFFCLFYALYKKNKMLLGIYASFAVAVFASSISMFPVNKRLWLFFYPLAVLVVFSGTEEFLRCVMQDHSAKGIRAGQWLLPLVALACCVFNAGIRYYWNDENVYWPGYEYKAEYEYLCELIEDENVYVFSGAYPGFLYYNQYDDTHLLNRENPVYVGYLPLGKNNDCEKDMNYILGSDKCYIFMSDTWDHVESTEVLFSQTHQQGFMEMVYYGYETPLWYYCKDAKDSLSNVSYTIIDEKTDMKGTMVYAVEVKNTGRCYLNPKFETLQLVEEEGNSFYELPDMIAPGDSVVLEMTVTNGETKRYHLKNEYRMICEDVVLELGGK